MENIPERNFRKTKTSSWNDICEKYMKLIDATNETIKHFKCISN